MPPALAATFDHDLIGDRLEWSVELKALYGFAPDEAATIRAVESRMHPDDAVVVATAFKQARDPAGTGLFDFEHRIVTSAGEVRWLKIKGVTLFDGSPGERRPTRSIGTVTDITERQRRAR